MNNNNELTKIIALIKELNELKEKNSINDIIRKDKLILILINSR